MSQNKQSQTLTQYAICASVAKQAKSNLNAVRNLRERPGIFMEHSPEFFYGKCSKLLNRHFLYSHVKEKSKLSQKAIKILQPRKGKIEIKPKNDKNFTAT